MKIFRQCLKSLNIAFSMYSKIPVPKSDWSEENMKYVMCFFPCVGIVTGLLYVFWAALSFHFDIRDSLRNVILLFIPVAVTGGIHLDGFLDTQDALSSWRRKDERLKILKDPHIGSFAVISGIVYFFLMYGAVDYMRGRMVAVCALGFVISRALSAFSVVTFPKSSDKGLAAGFSEYAKKRAVQITSAGYITAAGILMFLLSPIFAGAALAGAALAFIWYYHMAMKYFGGTSGDIAGYFLSVCELAVPLALTAVSIVLSLFL